MFLAGIAVRPWRTLYINVNRKFVLFSSRSDQPSSSVTCVMLLCPTSLYIRYKTQDVELPIH